MRLNLMDLATTNAAWWAHSAGRVAVICGITVAFAALGHVVRGVTRWGAIVGGLICFALFAAAGPGAFAALLSVFALTWSATRIGLASKQRLGTAERREGRGPWQVLANLGIAALCAIFSVRFGEPLWMLAMAASLSEAAADTVSSECGQAFSNQARLITNFRIVPAGTDGGVTAIGTLAGALAALLVSLVCALTRLVSPRGTLIATLAGIAGMAADSFLGAWFERRGWLGNDAVNFVSTALAAGMGLACGHFMH
jgi:uncharacterized protein (TIGR00297 family)